jgi:hypothetical protein
LLPDAKVSLNTLARVLVVMGILLILSGGVVYLFGRFNLPLGKLPGDLRIVRENFTCIFPLTTMIVISVVLTVILNVILRLVNRK